IADVDWSAGRGLFGGDGMGRSFAGEFAIGVGTGGGAGGTCFAEMGRDGNADVAAGDGGESDRRSDFRTGFGADRTGRGEGRSGDFRTRWRGSDGGSADVQCPEEVFVGEIRLAGGIGGGWESRGRVAGFGERGGNFADGGAAFGAGAGRASGWTLQSPFLFGSVCGAVFVRFRAVFGADRRREGFGVGRERG